MQDRLDNMTTKGLDVSSAQTILTQIVNLRPQLQTAFDNRDENAIQSINAQLVSLDQQFNQALHTIMSEARTQTNRTMLRTTNRTNGNYTINKSNTTAPGA
jgi:formate dehydrogenase maturation protein FdhE